MEFREKQSIYMQIADYFTAHILAGTWAEDEKVPSVRQLSVELEVNPNTVMRTYSYLQDNEVIYNKRGIGYFVSKGAKKIVNNMAKKRFIEEELPHQFKAMKLLEISCEEIDSLYKEWLNKYNDDEYQPKADE